MRRNAAAAVAAPFHALRAAVLAGTVVALAAGAHAVGGGALPPLPILLALATLTAMAATAATSVRLTAPAVLAVLCSGQIILHEALTALGSSSAIDHAARQENSAGHGSSGHNEAITAAVPAGAGLADHAQVLTGPGAGMLLAHAAATVLCALLLSRGEAALWALAAWLRPLVALPEAMVSDDAVHPPAASGAEQRMPCRPWRNLRQDSRRGPPASVAAT